MVLGVLPSSIHRTTDDSFFPSMTREQETIANELIESAVYSVAHYVRNHRRPGQEPVNEYAALHFTVGAAIAAAHNKGKDEHERMMYINPNNMEPNW